MAKNNQFCYMCGKSVNEVNKLFHNFAILIK